MTAAELKIILQVQKDGCLPKRSDFRTIRNMEENGTLWFDEKRGCYRIKE